MNLILCFLVTAVALSAQPALSSFSIAGHILDPSDAPVPSVRVLLKTPSGPRETTTGALGDFRFDPLPPGSYEIHASVPGFDPAIRKIRVSQRSPSPITIRLALASVKERIDVTSQTQTVLPDAGANADTISVERTLLDNLPFLDLNYLSALSRFLDPGTPGSAGTSLIVDGVEMRNAGVTPSAIQEIRINNNPYTAEYPRWSRRRIEVITKSSTSEYHGTFNFLLRDYHLNARDAFATLRPQEHRRIFEGSLFGPLGNRNRSSFLLSASREEENLVAVVFAQGPLGPIRDNVPTPQFNSFASLRLSHQRNEKQALFVQLNWQDRWQNNLGVGGTTLAEAGARSRFREDEFVFNHRAVLSPNLLSQFRILIGRYWSPTQSNLDAPKLVVTDAFTRGGAQADRLSTEFHTSISWLLTHTVRRHTLKYGVNVPDWSRRGLSDRTNSIGTLSFASLADFTANRPLAAVLQRGNPRLVFIEKNLGVFLQDEWQLRPNLSLAAGVRYDWQNYFGDPNNFAPRLAIAYAPGKSRKTVLRTGAGLFFDRSGPGPIFDILRFDGTRLRRYVLNGAQIPPDLTNAALLPFPPSLHRLENGVQLPAMLQFSAGLERQLSPKTTLALNYVGTRGTQQLRSRDANTPLPPNFTQRPDPSLNALRVIEAAGRLAGNALEITLRGNIAPRVTTMTQYVFGRTRTNTGGVNWFPADSFSPTGEWGLADTDRRHQFNFLGTASPHRWANFGLSVSLLSGVPFNITTGRDDNRDGMALDRPPGVIRNSGAGPGAAIIDLRWYREFRLHPEKKEKSPSFTISADAFNALNRVNYQNFAGALTSPFFGQAVGAQPPRRLQLGCRFQF